MVLNMASGTSSFVPIKSIKESQNCVSICGLIIGKSDARFFESSNKETRGVMTFTVRDSAKDFVNCTCWGSEMFIGSAENYKIGEAVVFSMCKVQNRKDGENFQPRTSSPFQLTLNEGRGSIQKSEYTKEMNAFRGTPLKPSFSVLMLKDLNLNSGVKCVDLLVILTHMKPCKEFMTKTGKRQNLREVFLADRSLTTGVSLTIWSQGIIERSLCWTTMTTVLHLVDVQVSYSQYYKQVALSTNSMTIIVENPHTKEAKSLLSFAATIPTYHFAKFEDLFGTAVDLGAITKVMTLQQILDCIQNGNFNDNNQFTALAYVVITAFDLDGSIRVFTRKCSQCHSYLQNTESHCSSAECKSAKICDFFDFRLSVSDHSGTISNCRLVGKNAELTLGVSLTTFLSLPNEVRCSLKWKYLLERCAVKFVIYGKTVHRRSEVISIVDMKIANSDEVAENAIVY